MQNNLQDSRSIYLIDISSFIFRAFFAIPNLSTSKGHPTNATYGVIAMLTKLINAEKPQAILCVFDSKEPSFRKKEYSAYKANRGEPPELLRPQFDDIEKAIALLGVPCVRAPGFEADDIIATATSYYKDHNIVIVTGDKDLMQLVSDRVVMYDTMKEAKYTPELVEAKLGVPPALVPDYLGLIGDSSDNIPGVPGIGPKTAVELLKAHGSLEGVLEAVPTMKGKRAEMLKSHAADAKLSKYLATVRYDLNEVVPGLLPKSLNDLAMPRAVPGPCIDYLNELELTSLAKKLSLPVMPQEQGAALAPVAVASAAVSTTKVLGKESEQLEFIKQAQAAGYFSVCLLTDGAQTAELSGVAVYWPNHQAVIMNPSSKVTTELFNALRASRVVSSNTKELAKAMSTHAGAQPGWRPARPWVDVMIAQYLIGSEEKLSIEDIATRYLDRSIPILDKECSLESKAERAAQVAHVCYDVTEGALMQALKEAGAESLFNEIEMPLSFELAGMEIDGIAIDLDVLSKLSVEFAAELAGLESSIYKIAGTEFNLNSPKQLAEILFTKLGLPVVKKTKTGFSTDVDVLEKLSAQHEVPAYILRYRELTKLKSTYIDVLPGLIAKDGRVHASFNQTVTATGRLSSSDPNLQNIPVKTPSGRRIRSAFVPARGHVFVGADYSQVELRIVAHLSQDPALLRAFRENKDVHKFTAAEIFNTTEDAVTDAQRSVAKAINFGLIYGKTAFGLAQELSIPKADAQAYIDSYFLRYSGVKIFMDDCLRLARETGEARTLFGRRRRIRDILSKNMAVRNNAERMAMNTPVQGAAADIMKIAMIRVAPLARALGARVVLQVHDELVLDVPISKAKEAQTMLMKEMSAAAKLDVPLEVNAGIAENWMEL